jgi:hypothetical protein
MSPKPLPGIDVLGQWLRYEEDAGGLTWTRQPSARIKAGTRAGSMTSCGYIRIAVGEHRFLEHRAVWLLTEGEDPGERTVDHVNRRRDDNRRTNLRLADRSEQVYNQGRRRDNSSGHRGVSLRRGRWCAYITIRGRKQHLGNFQRLEDAIAARAAAELRLGIYPSG